MPRRFHSSHVAELVGHPIHYPHESAADAVHLEPTEARGWRRELVDAVMLATDVGKRRPPLLGSRGFGKAADVARELHPDRPFAGAIAA